MRLIDRVYHATKIGDLIEPFSSADLKNWILQHNVCQRNGKRYEKSSINALLSNSAKHNIPTSNLNEKVLCSKINANNKREYWFDFTASQMDKSTE